MQKGWRKLCTNNFQTTRHKESRKENTSKSSPSHHEARRQIKQTKTCSRCWNPRRACRDPGGGREAEGGVPGSQGPGGMDEDPQPPPAAPGRWHLQLLQRCPQTSRGVLRLPAFREHTRDVPFVFSLNSPATSNRFTPGCCHTIYVRGLPRARLLEHPPTAGLAGQRVPWVCTH